MVVGAVECRAFRNLADARITIAGDIVVVHGPNGAGKTNLLEAVYFGLTGRSFRAGNDRDMIRFDEDGARIELELDETSSTLLAALDRTGERRHLLGDGPIGAAGEARPPVSGFPPPRLPRGTGTPAPRRGPPDRPPAAIWPARRAPRA